ncbi:Na(+)/H(+) exchange regulatory cofactor NHE-RF4 isoform X7 [Heterocephalus glaber]|uniref:Na(+)/H(+) exchange regulatory cofactor NHE-RF4 isoform X7 n=1 Tax=Heterocephalus glaber TaxID=10181 RepID=A0AAX6RC44_HETGA|nr:Na(+)/H(+) exchange regulatory cofactor NHE-RF4 isoform X7 [Heterocephalus glaber]
MEAAADLQDTASLTVKFKFNPKLGIDNPVLSLAEDYNCSGVPWQEATAASHAMDLYLGCAPSPSPSLLPTFPSRSLEFASASLLSVEQRGRQEFWFSPSAAAGQGWACGVQSGARHLCPLPRSPGRRSDSGSEQQCCGARGPCGGAQGPFWLVLSTGGAAERAGVPPGARLLEVNGVSVEKFTHYQLSRKLWQSGKQVTLLVAGPEVEDQCRQLGMPLAAPLAEGWTLPAKPRCLHLEKGPKGFGFLLREEKGIDGRLGQFLREVDPGLPAEKAGMRAGDRLVAVAGESVEELGHGETVSRIREQGSRVSLTVVDPEADRFFSMVRLSPLLFLESTEPAASPKATDLTSPVETENRPVEHKAGSPGPPGSCQCFLYPGPGGGYGFRLSCVTSGPCLFISQVTPGGSAAQAGLQMGDVVLEVNGYPVGGDSDLERLQQLAEAEPPLCLTLAARSQEGLEAWIPPGYGEDRALASDLL